MARIRAWFERLNPYENAGSLLKLEDVNYKLGKGGEVTDEIEELFCICVSSKRYVLFNLTRRGRPIIRKASAHGLGHLIPPHEDSAATPQPKVKLSKIGVRRWQYDVWYRIIEEVIAGRVSNPVGELPGFDQPAASRYSATTPELLRWFNPFNRGKPYREQVRPFGFMIAFSAADHSPVAPFSRDLSEAAASAFDRNSGAAVPSESLGTYAESLAQYHLHPESKFANADYLDSGVTERRHVHVVAREYIGKEADRWERRAVLGALPDDGVEYGGEADLDMSSLRRSATSGSVRALAAASGLSVGLVSEFRSGLRGLTALQASRIHLGLMKITGRLNRRG